MLNSEISEFNILTSAFQSPSQSVATPPEEMIL